MLLISSLVEARAAVRSSLVREEGAADLADGEWEQVALWVWEEARGMVEVGGESRRRVSRVLRDDWRVEERVWETVGAVNWRVEAVEEEEWEEACFAALLFSGSSEISMRSGRESEIEGRAFL